MEPVCPQTHQHGKKSAMTSNLRWRTVHPHSKYVKSIPRLCWLLSDRILHVYSVSIIAVQTN